MRKPREYVQSGDHLPDIMKDFHDQKDLFKTIEFIQGRAKVVDKEISWMEAQVYVIDHFLWFMAQRGYTLQRSRAKVGFKDLVEDVKKHQDASAQALKALLDERSKNIGI